jgi:hypothetical protein
MKALSCASDDVLRMHPARCQDCNGINVFPRQKMVDIVIGGNPKFGRYSVGARANRVADSVKLSLPNIVATQQFRMALRNATASEQPKFDHQTFLLKFVNLVLYKPEDCGREAPI